MSHSSTGFYVQLMYYPSLLHVGASLNIFFYISYALIIWETLGFSSNASWLGTTMWAPATLLCF